MNDRQKTINTQLARLSLMANAARLVNPPAAEAIASALELVGLLVEEVSELRAQLETMKKG